jgi:hypothetical protein
LRHAQLAYDKDVQRTRAILTSSPVFVYSVRSQRATIVAMSGSTAKSKKQTNKNAYRRAKKKAQRSVSDTSSHQSTLVTLC